MGFFTNKQKQQNFHRAKEWLKNVFGDNNVTEGEDRFRPCFIVDRTHLRGINATILAHLIQQKVCSISAEYGDNFEYSVSYAKDSHHLIILKTPFEYAPEGMIDELKHRVNAATLKIAAAKRYKVEEKMPLPPAEAEVNAILATQVLRSATNEHHWIVSHEKTEDGLHRKIYKTSASFSRETCRELSYKLRETLACDGEPFRDFRKYKTPYSELVDAKFPPYEAGLLQTPAKDPDRVPLIIPCDYITHNNIGMLRDSAEQLSREFSEITHEPLHVAKTAR